jgi:GT2 family glycosyltransferase/thioredoxin-like negative regulator of GroEL
LTPRVLYLCPDDDTPSGGIRVIYRHVDVLNEAGIPAAVLHATPGFRCTWFEHETRIVHEPVEGAVIAIPEIYGPELASLFPGARKVIVNQNAYNTFNGYSLGSTASAYAHPEVEAAIVVSEDNAAYLRHAFPQLKVLRTVNRVDPELFRPASMRRRRIAFMPRRGLQDALQVLHILRVRGVLDGVELAPLDGLDEREVAAALSDALVFLSLGTAEGCPTPPKEAMASGCLTVGYAGGGAQEFMTPGVAYPVTPGNIVEFARVVEELLAQHPGDPVQLPAVGRAASELIHERHSPEAERASVLACWRELLGEPDEETAPLVSIAILTLNGLHHTRLCLESIERATDLPYELLLVDNGSTDGTVDYLRDFAALRSNVSLVLNAENKGFAGGNNQALALARGKHVVLLNNDTVVTSGWLSRLVDTVERLPGVGLVGPVSNYVSGAQLVDAGYGTLDELERFAADWGASHDRRFQPTGRLVGFCLLMTREVVDAVGGLDERFGSGNFEDDDLCLRARSAGFGCVIARDVFIHHTGSQTFLGAGIDYRASIERNWAVFEEKWGASVDELFSRGPAAVAPAVLERNRRLELPEVTVDAGRVHAEEPRGELRVELLLLGARSAVLEGRHDELRACFAEPAGWDEPQRAYQAVRHLCELVLAAGERLEADGWIPLYEAAADGLLGVLEREPSEPVLLNFAGVFLYELAQRDAAVALFEAGLRLDPELGGAGDNLAAARVLKATLDRPALAGVAERALRVATAAQPAEGLTLSLCMIVKDEEEMLPGCLEAAAAGVDEIVVVDTGSTDRTVEIAESFGAKVVRFPWNGSFADARNVSLEHATGDWIVYLDADEHLADGAADGLRSLRGKTWREGFYLLETNLTGADDAGSAVTHPALRVFRNRPEYRFEGRIHEQKTRLMPTYLPERFETTELRVRHYGYLGSRVAAKDKSRRNLELLEVEAGESPSPFAAFNLGSEHQMLGDWERAADHFDEAWDLLRLEPDWHAAGYAPLLAVRAARARRELGRLADARALVDEALVHWPDYTDLHFELAVCAQAAGELEEAERLLLHCLELGDAPSRYVGTLGAGSHVALGVLGEVAESRGDAVRAERLYREALDRHPGFAAPAVPLALLLLESHRPAEAEDVLRRALAVQPANPVARLALLEALVAQGRLAEAADAASAEDAESPAAAEVELLARAATGDEAGLAAAFERARRAGVEDAELAFHEAWAAVRTGRSGVDRLPPASLEPALRVLDRLLQAQAFTAFEAALPVFELVDADPAERSARLARLYLLRGFVDSAEDEWRRRDLDASGLVGLAQVALVRRQPDDAAAYAALALERDPAHEEARRLVTAIGAG